MNNNNQEKLEIFPVILCGGAGTRLWPMSRQHYPKQLLKLTSDNSLLQETVLRTSGGDFMPPLLVTNAEYRFTIAEQLAQINRNQAKIILEPVGRNTAPAAAIAALEVISKKGDGILIVVPSDHLIRDQVSFLKATTAAIEAARGGALVTYGIKATGPETGYGYIQSGEPHPDYPDCMKIDRFVEKPDLETAKHLIQDPTFTWNSGMFVFRASKILTELERHHPKLLSACKRAYEASVTDLDFLRLDEEEFASCPSDSIDYAIMEKTENSVVIPVEMGWDDIGSWDSLHEVQTVPGGSNVTHGDVISIDTKTSYVRSEGPLIATVGIDNLVVVATNDAVLVCRKNRTQDIKEVVGELEKRDRPEHRLHTQVYRPWGYYQTIDSGDQFQVKRITVNPGARLSLQKHKHRAEHWVVVRGTATVTRGDEVSELAPNQSTYIPAGTVHRLENKTASSLEIIEVQSGDYLGEDDIVRYEDTYGRSE